jgi:hypothetical protein
VKVNYGNQVKAVRSLPPENQKAGPEQPKEKKTVELLKKIG